MSKALIHRICKLEALIMPAKQTEFSRHLLQRLETGRLRAEAKGHEGPGPPEVEPFRALTGTETIEEILNSGRDRVASASAQAIEVPRAPSHKDPGAG